MGDPDGLEEDSSGEMGSTGNRATTSSSGEAVLLGALAGGVNAPTWATLRMVLLALAASLLLLLPVALNSTGIMPLLHVSLLIAMAGLLFLLLNWFISQTGLVSVEQQMAELNLIGEKHVRNAEALEKQGHHRH